MNLYPQVRYQTFLGFGGAITEAVGLVLQALPPETARQVLNSYYGPSGIGYSLVRTHLDSCDFSRENYCAIEDEDTDFSTFSLRHDERNIIPYILMAEELAGKKLPVMLSPWSPPAFMKTTNTAGEASRSPACPFKMSRTPHRLGTAACIPHRKREIF